ncbi:MAG: 2-oxo acid dehydrogenase subunit E2 [Pseudomonadales bacterium]|nr:2-oxo acid dehydrogenase subunit E2 [Pseudomonadales bacterium]
MKYFKLPDLGEGLQEAEIVEWHVKSGDEIEIDQLMVSVETAKAIVEVPSPQQGIIATLFGKAGDIVHVGEPLVEFSGEEQEDTGTVVGEMKTASEDDVEEDHFIIGSGTGHTHNTTRATPAIRALAKRLDVDLSTVSPTGKHGMITLQDVERAHELQDTHGAAELIKGVRRSMAKNMARAHAEVVPVTLMDDADIHQWTAGTDPTIRLIRAIGVACSAEPALNVWFDGNALSRRFLDNVDLGMAVDTKDGLFVPVLRDISNRTATELRKGLDNLMADVKSRTIPPKELQGSTITLTNFGTIAGRYASPIVVPPSVAIVGAGVVREEVVVQQGQMVIHKIMPISISADHRAVTGGEVARFLKALIKDLEQGL